MHPKYDAKMKMYTSELVTGAKGNRIIQSNIVTMSMTFSMEKDR